MQYSIRSAGGQLTGQSRCGWPVHEQGISSFDKEASSCKPKYLRVSVLHQLCRSLRVLDGQLELQVCILVPLVSRVMAILFEESLHCALRLA